MARRKLVNISFIVEDDFTTPFTVSGYTFHPQIPVQRQGTINVIRANQILRDNRRNIQNAYVEYIGPQRSSVIFQGGRVGANPQNSRERKILEDLLVLGSVLTAHNWQLFSYRRYVQFPIISRNHLEYISRDSNQCREHMEAATTCLLDQNWQRQFRNGFHLPMLLNHANILNAESRFLSMVVLWEWLYPHLHNPQGATPNDESNNLREIFYFILNHFWPNQVDASLRTSNIFHVLRNQLAHSGKLPINRGYADQWMTQLQWDRTATARGINDYLKFFDRLTQVVVLKTLGIDGEQSLTTFNFPQQLQTFLSTGRI